jgi:hypothetical protein
MAVIIGILFSFQTSIHGNNIVNDIVKETMLQSQMNQTVRIAWWIPEEFWTESFKSNPAVSKTQMDQFISIIHPYTLIVAVDGKVGVMGGVTYSSENDVRTSIELTSPTGKKYSPIGDSLYTPDLKNFLSMMKPVLGNMLGQMGANMNFYLFQGDASDTLPLVSANSSGSFKVKLEDEDFKFRLPISALIPKRTCPECKETFPGTYMYCPYDGKKTKVTK